MTLSAQAYRANRIAFSKHFLYTDCLSTPDSYHFKTEMERLISSFKDIETAITQPTFNGQVLADAVACLEDALGLILDYGKGILPVYHSFHM